MYSRFIVGCVFALILLSGALGQNDPDVVCSVKQPNNSQACISVKLPWELKPVFFCTDKSNINFTPQCNGHGQSHHCRDDGRTDTLKIATPWDCCPIISEPNKCSNIRCAPEPFNRTCQAIKKPGACCANYMCDGDQPAKCKAKRLEPGCLTPLPAQTNCTAFRDPYGCCHVYQCPRNEKAGTCPREPHVSENVDTRSTWTRLLDSFKSTVHKVTNEVKSHLEKHGGAVGKAISQMIPVPFQPNIPLVPLIRCTGDYTCPGSMKCCQPLAFQFQAVARFRHETRNGHIKTSFQFKANGRQKRSDPNVIEGVCVEPEDGSIYPAFTDGPQIESTTDSSYLTSTIAAVVTRSTFKPRKPPVLPKKSTLPTVPSTAAPHQPPPDPTNPPAEPQTTPSESPVATSVTVTQTSPSPVQPELDRTDAPENPQNFPVNEPPTSIAPPVPVTAENIITSSSAYQTDSVEQPATTPAPTSQPPSEPATTPVPEPQPPAESATSSAPLNTAAPPQTTPPVTLSTTTEAEEKDTIVLA